MIVSTKGRYALRVMVELAQHQGDGYVPLNVIAERQDISFLCSYWDPGCDR